MSLRRCMAEVSSAEYIEWVAEYTIEPWGEERADWRMAQLCSIVANIMRRKGAPPARLRDFMWDSRPKRMTGKEIEGVFNQYLAVYRAAQRKRGAS